MQNRSTYVVSNWKMNGTTALIHDMVQTYRQSVRRAHWILCPPATLITETRRHYPEIALGGQDCHHKTSGAFTGDISAHLLTEAGASYVILGHSERRHYHGETSTTVAEKACTAISHGLTPIICIGESEETYDKKQTIDFLKKQLNESLANIHRTQHNVIVAYEPIWAIGTGKTATVTDIEQVHTFLREQLPNTPLLYGGSVTGSNAREILSTQNVNGVLVGGASLKTDEFAKILDAAC